MTEHLHDSGPGFSLNGVTDVTCFVEHGGGMVA